MQENKYCGYCGSPLSPGAKFCGVCGKKVDADPTPKKETASGSSSDSILGHLNNYLGNADGSSLNWKYLFSGVFTRHTLDEAENIFICGTKTTTPDPDTIGSTWPKPWLYSRVFVGMIVVFMLLYVCCSHFSNPNAYPGLLIIGAFTVPLVTVILFMEVNAFRNISFYKVIGIVMIGGCASLVATLFLFDLNLVDSELGTLWGGLMTGLIEEVGKAVIVYVIIKRLNLGLYILPALLVGAAVGAGFAAFESAGYAFKPLFRHIDYIAYWSAHNGRPELFDYQAVLSASTGNILVRGYLAPGGHVAWAAISGAAIVIAAKKEGSLTPQIFKSSTFWKIFIIPIVLHGLWDTPFIDSRMWYIGLIVAVWIVVLIFIEMGLKQVASLNKPLPQPA